MQIWYSVSGQVYDHILCSLFCGKLQCFTPSSKKELLLEFQNFQTTFLANLFQAKCILWAYLLILLIKTQAKLNQLEQVECHICAEDISTLIYGSKKQSLN